MNMKAVVRYGLEYGQVEVQEVPVPEIGEGDVLLHVKSRRSLRFRPERIPWEDNLSCTGDPWS